MRLLLSLSEAMGRAVELSASIVFGAWRDMERACDDLGKDQK